MSSPLSLPSKAAIRALRSLALGTSCAIGVLVEDRRRRISTLKAAVANKQKLQSSRHYHHGGAVAPVEQLDSVATLDHDLHWHEREDYGRRKHRGVKTTDYPALEHAVTRATETRNSPQEENNMRTLQQTPPPPLPQPQSQSQSPSSLPSPWPAISLHTSRVPIRRIRPEVQNSTSISGVMETCQPDAPGDSQQSYDLLIRSIEGLLVNADKEYLDRAVSLFVANSSAVTASSRLDRWLELSIRLSRECRGSGRWEDCSQILRTTIPLVALDESQYIAYDPISIIEFHLRRPDPNTPCSLEALNLATQLLISKPKKGTGVPGTLSGHMVHVGKRLILEALSSPCPALSTFIYWRIIGWAEELEEFVRWTIHTLYGHRRYKHVVKYFLLHYSYTSPPKFMFDQTMDYVVTSAEAEKGLRAPEILEAFARMDCPEDGKLRTRWIMKLLNAYWARHQDVSKVVDLFEKAVALGLLDRVSHTQGIYRTLVEIAVRADDIETANLYADKVIHEYPEMKKDIALKLAVRQAKAGDWNAVLEAFKQTRPSELAIPGSYTDTFIGVLKLFAESHTAAETRDFAMLFVESMHIGLHPYMVTLVIKKCGKDGDVTGLISWLELCNRKGFVLDAAFCNSILHVCSTAFKFSFPELRMMVSKFKAIYPDFNDEVTQRMLSQAVQRGGRTFTTPQPRATVVSKEAYLGRSTNTLDIHEAMSQAIRGGRPASAIKVYTCALEFGMPFSGHCLRLAVLAKLQVKSGGPEAALSMIQDAHAQGRDVEPAVSGFVKQLGQSYSRAEDLNTLMLNLMNIFESSRIAVRPAVLTHMAVICARITQYEKAMALCRLARDRSRESHFCFSVQIFNTMATVYFHLRDAGGMESLIDNLPQSSISTDRAPLAHLKSIRRYVNKMAPGSTRTALLEAVERGVQHMTKARATARQHGVLTLQKTLEVMRDGLVESPSSTEQSMRLISVSAT
ncbi:hypothetical protein F4802DRAFT_568384 [Xylaria palmicola]|nr:hypothetical protein F4802DRAFT_568384 [Xylaria palmicola]